MITQSIILKSVLDTQVDNVERKHRFLTACTFERESSRFLFSVLFRPIDFAHDIVTDAASCRYDSRVQEGAAFSNRCHDKFSILRGLVALGNEGKVHLFYECFVTWIRLVV